MKYLLILLLFCISCSTVQDCDNLVKILYPEKSIVRYNLENTKIYPVEDKILVCYIKEFSSNIQVLTVTKVQEK